MPPVGGCAQEEGVWGMPIFVPVRCTFSGMPRYTEIHWSGGQSRMVIDNSLTLLGFRVLHSLDSGSSGGNPVGVRVSPSAPLIQWIRWMRPPADADRAVAWVVSAPALWYSSGAARRPVRARAVVFDGCGRQMLREDSRDQVADAVETSVALRGDADHVSDRFSMVEPS